MTLVYALTLRLGSARSAGDVAAVLRDAERSLKGAELEAFRESAAMRAGSLSATRR